MPFRFISSELLTFTPPRLGEQFFQWRTCDESPNRYVCLRTNEHHKIDIFQINLEIEIKPKPRIRISTEIFCPILLAKMRDENFNYHSFIPPNSHPHKKRIPAANCHCEFGTDEESKNNARDFLTALVTHSKLPEFSSASGREIALYAFSNWIFILASKYKAFDLTLGTEWINSACNDYTAKKLAKENWNRNKSMLAHCSLFAIAVTTSLVTTIAIMKNTL